MSNNLIKEFRNWPRVTTCIC